jgi:hypothetical protein
MIKIFIPCIIRNFYTLYIYKFSYLGGGLEGVSLLLVIPLLLVSVPLSPEKKLAVKLRKATVLKM